MSAFMVSSDHIDYMLTAGIVLVRPHGPLRWTVREITEDDRLAAFERGEPWGPSFHKLYEELRRELTPETAGQVGAMLLAENRASVDHRYDEEEIEQPYLYRQVLPHDLVTPVGALKAIACYEYQSCEHPEWIESEARRFCQTLKDSLVHKLDGWDEAAWTWTRPAGVR